MATLPQTSHVDAVPPERRWSLGQQPWLDEVDRHPRARVIIDNDFIGDPDDLFQLAHHLLSPTVEIPLVIASHLHAGEGWDPSEHQAEHGAAVARDLFERMGIASTERVVAGAEHALPDPTTPVDTPAARAIIAEASRESTLPLYYCAGGGLTDLASALLIEPSIAAHLTLVWIGGSEHPELAASPPGAALAEYNLSIDLAAAQLVFGSSDIPIWQVPRSTYRQALLSSAEMRHDYRPLGSVGQFLYDEIHGVHRVLVDHPDHGTGGGEVYCMGDQPLVLLTALQSTFEPDPASSSYVTRPTHAIDDEGLYLERPEARPMRVYTSVDNRLTFSDFRAKLAELAAWQRGDLDPVHPQEQP